MALISYDPWRELRALRAQMDSFFGERFGAGDDSSQVVTGLWSPAVDIKEEEDRFVLHADVPGVDPKAIDITMENGVLTIKGERREEKTEKREQYSRTERVYGAFYRRFALPNSAEADEISASSRNGVLEVVIPKQEKAKARQIEVRG
jgi:HSP20 family protein